MIEGHPLGEMLRGGGYVLADPTSRAEVVMTMPSDNRDKPGLFDRSADRVSAFTSKA
jgi:hypothetical protein